MARIIFISASGLRSTLEVSPGTSVMRAAVANGVDGIVGECGGSAMCATCHCYVDEAFVERLPKVSPVEAEMLNSTARRTAG